VVRFAPFFGGGWRSLFVAATGSWCVALAAAEPARPTITHPNQVWAMSMAERGLTYPISTEVRINHVDAEWKLLWVQNDESPGFFHLADLPPPLRPGQVVRLEGFYNPQRGLAGDSLTVTVLKDFEPITPLPTAGRISDRALFDQRVVEAEGLVDGQQLIGDRHLRLTILTENRRVICWVVPDDPTNLPDWQRNRVRVQAVYSARADATGTETTIELWVPRQSDVTVVGTLDDDERFALATTPIRELTLKPRGEVIKVRGLLQRRDLGQSIVVRDDTGAVPVHSLQRERIPLGTEVEAVGEVAISGAKWSIQSGLFRRAPELPGGSVADDPADLVLRNAEQIRQMSLEEAASARPVEISGVVSWSLPDTGYFFLQDAGGGIRIHFDLATMAAPPLQKHLLVRGVTFDSGYVPAVQLQSFDDLGAMGTPPPKPVTYEQAITGNENGQWVEVRGFVQRKVSRGDWRSIHLATPSGEVVADVLSPVDFAAPPGTLVRVQGVCDTPVDESGRILGVLLRMPYLHDLTVEEDAPADPFQLPLRSIKSLRQLAAVQDMTRAKIVATVIHHLPERFVYVQQEDAGLLLISSHPEALAPGDTIEAVGILGSEGARTVLRETLVRRLQRGPPPPPVPLTEPHRLLTQHDGRLVEVAAEVIDLARLGDAVRLTLQSDQTLFTATLPHRFNGANVPDLQLGALVQLTGVYRLGYDDARQTRSFELLLRTPADVLVLQPARLLTLQRALLACALLAVLALGGLAWVTLLRRRVRRQTDQIRVQLEKEVALEDRHRAIIESASDGIFTADLDGRLQSINPAGERLTGYRRDEIRQHHLRDLLRAACPSDQDRVLPLPTDDNAITFQREVLTKDNRSIWVETSMRLIGQASAPGGVLGIMRDISERKQIEEELKRARDAAEASTRSKSAFLANMSHEIRTPMNGVIGMTGLLLETPLTEEQREFAETASKSGEALLTIINDILDFSKIEAGKLQLEQVAFDPSEAIEDVLDLLVDGARNHQIELIASFAPDTPATVVGDPGRFRQILINLVGNAVKFTEQGEVCVTVTTLSGTHGTQHLHVAVRDTGIGLSPDDQARLFQSFTQVDNSTTRRYGGTGLGLAISRQLVELMGGDMGLISEEGSGSTFWFRIPAREAAPPAPLLPPSWVRGARVLLAEDNATSSNIVSQWLKCGGAQVQPAADGESALHAIRTAQAAQEPFDLVLLDDQLTVGGAPVVSAIREASRAELPIVLFLALTQGDHRALVERHGRLAVIRKPLRRSRLLRALHDLNGSTRPTDKPFPPLRPDAPTRCARILVAEDNVTNQLLTRRMVERLGHQVTIVESGRTALAAMASDQFDLVLMDCQMPDLDGLEAAREQRRREASQGAMRLPLIALTANAIEGHREQCLEAGMDDYLTKPIKLDALAAKLERWLKPAAPDSTGNNGATEPSSGA
jgi:PAS domain S-box-containing protein